MRFFFVTAIGIVALAAGCSPTFAPPPQSTHYGAPGRLRPQDAEDGEIAGALGTEGNVAANVALPLAPDVRLEVGGDVGRSWVLGQTGLRLGLFDSALNENGSIRIAGDATVGGAFGRGGERCGNQAPDSGCDGTASADGLPWHQRYAYGAWLGLGFGLHLDWFTPFVRGTVRISDATGIPTTTWLSFAGGIELDLWDTLDVYAAMGWAGYDNAEDTNSTLFLEAGLSIPFGETPQE